MDRSDKGASIRYRMRPEGQEVVAEVLNRPDQPTTPTAAKP